MMSSDFANVCTLVNCLVILIFFHIWSYQNYHLKPHILSQMNKEHGGKQYSMTAYSWLFLQFINHDLVTCCPSNDVIKTCRNKHCFGWS